jgi:prevent-host-death family protein
MPVIRSVSDLRNNFTTFSETVHNDNEPVFLTKNGVSDMVVTSIDYYEQQMAKLELYQKLNVARTEIENGAAGKDARKLLQELMSK